MFSLAEMVQKRRGVDLRGAVTQEYGDSVVTGGRPALVLGLITIGSVEVLHDVGLGEAGQ
ncbi:hypothetical protein ACFRQM_40700 [Streptomyces sp. NPDC056831]|uniref:hypothetical protein n=1 Tax=Streptomyces sp. NPDC056831 TaxID=3345954 RepID=UPI003683C0BF